MEGWVDLGSLIVARPGIEPTTAWSQVWHPNCYANVSSNVHSNVVILMPCFLTYRQWYAYIKAVLLDIQYLHYENYWIKKTTKF